MSAFNLIKQIIFTLILLASAICNSIGQTEPLKPEIRHAVYFDVSPPLGQMHKISPADYRTEPAEVPNKIGRRELDPYRTNSFPFQEDAVWQKQDGTYLPSSAATIQNFDGITNLSDVYPPDTQGDVGPNKYVQVVNKSFAVYSKTGATLLAPTLLNTIWAGIPAPWDGTNSGDPVVLYDQAANRWLISQFSLPFGSSGGSYAELLAISQTDDPAGTWYRYVFEFGSKLPDYPKFGIWPDAYYMSVNQFNGGSSWGGVGACALDRTKMLAGDPAASMIYFNLGGTGDPESMLPSDWDGAIAPVAGEPNHFTYFNDWTPGTTDYLKIWDFHADWNTPVNSTFSEAYSLATSPFDSDICAAYRERCIPQPGTTVMLESLSDRLMYRLQYRNFGSYRTMVANHTVDVDGTGHAAIRWYELRNNGSGWNIYQQGTYSPDATHRWVGSVAMNSSGDIALGYSVADATTTFPGIRYTGRKANDEQGFMTFAEQTIINGSGYQSGASARWGDYSMMSVDPADDNTFWFTTEYMETTGLKNWKTRIASFILPQVPSATTLPANVITTTTATLNGLVSPNGLATDYHFEYGTTTSYGTLITTVSAGSGTSLFPVSADISGLISGTTYHFRIVGINSQGTSSGRDMIFIAGLPVNRQLSNISISTGTSNCYNATQIITVAGSGTTFSVLNGGSATLIAGLKISILPGTNVQPGGNFLGYIAPSGPFCVNPADMPIVLVNNARDTLDPFIDDLFKVYPSPTGGPFTLELNNLVQPETLRVEIYNMTGEMVLSSELSGTSKHEFSLSGKPCGVYIIRVASDRSLGITRIIRQ